MTEVVPGEWGSTQVENAFTTLTQHNEQFRVKTARIVSPPGYEPQEVWIIWETFDVPDIKQYIRARGFLSQDKNFMLLSTEKQKDWKYMTYFFSNDSKLCAFVSESVELGHQRDVIQVESVKFHQAMFCIVLDKNDIHGAVYMSGPHCHFKFSPGNSRKLLYVARPTPEQMKTKNRKDRLFVICIYDFETKGITLITDENICEKPINSIEWTPDSRGIVFHRERELVWHRFGEQYVNKIFTNVPAPLKITFSPDENRLAIFLPTSTYSDSSILLFHWPFVKAAVTFQHEVIKMDRYHVWSVPERPWGNGGKYLLFNASWQCQVRNLVLEVDTLKFSSMNFPRPALIIDVQGEEMLFETLAANTHTRLWTCSLSLDPIVECRASFIASQKPEKEISYNFDVIPIFFDDNAYSGMFYIQPESASSGEKYPIVVMPYAGDKPSITQTCIDPSISTFVACGFCVLVVNYREPFVTYPGTSFPKLTNAGCMDDVHNAVLKVLKEYPSRVNEKYVCIYGDKFGSFVACSLLVKHQKFYKCGALIRPMLEFPPITEQDGVDASSPGVAYLKEAQPVSHANKIKTPLLMVIDRKDNHTYQVFETTLLQHGVPCYEEFEEDDEEVGDFVVKVIHFFKDPEDDAGQNVASEDEN